MKWVRFICHCRIQIHCVVVAIHHYDCATASIWVQCSHWPLDNSWWKDFGIQIELQVKGGAGRQALGYILSFHSVCKIIIGTSMFLCSIWVELWWSAFTAGCHGSQGGRETTEGSSCKTEDKATSWGVLHIFVRVHMVTSVLKYEILKWKVQGTLFTYTCVFAYLQNIA